MSNGLKRIVACLGMIGTAISMLAIQVIILYIVMAVYIIFKTVSFQEVSFNELISQPNVNGIMSVSGAVVTIIVLGLIYRAFKRNEITAKEVPQDIKPVKTGYFAGIILLGISIQAIGYGALNIIATYAADTEVFIKYNEIMKSLNVTMSPFMLLYVGLLAPVSEELVFRGLILDFGRFGFKTGTAIVLSALGFGLFHGNIVQGVYAALFGLILGYIRVSRNSLFDSMLAHIAINISGISLVPVLTAIVGTIIGQMAAYAIVCVTGMIICIMWFLHNWENRQQVQ